MKLTGTEDLRVQKTIEAIRTAFEQMICEMDYHEMTVKELCERAKINKKTFYRYYPAMDDLLLELQMEISSEYIERISRYHLPEELDKVNESFFRYSVEKGEVYEKITCASGYTSIRNRMTGRVNEATWEKSAWYNQQHSGLAAAYADRIRPVYPGGALQAVGGGRQKDPRGGGHPAEQLPDLQGDRRLQKPGNRVEKIKPDNQKP